MREPWRVESTSVHFPTRARVSSVVVRRPQDTLESYYAISAGSSKMPLRADHKLGYPQLIKIFASPSESFPRFWPARMIRVSSLREHSRKKSISRFLTERASPEKACRRRIFLILNLRNDRIPSLETAFLMYNPHRKCNKISCGELSPQISVIE